MSKRFQLVLLVATIVTGCGDFAPAKPGDPSRIVGCYGAAGTPTIEVGMERLRVVGTGIVIPYAYEQAKVGMVVRSLLNPTISQGQLRFTLGDERLFRVSFLEGKPLLTIAFGQAGEIVTYRLVSPSNCAD